MLYRVGQQREMVQEDKKGLEIDKRWRWGATACQMRAKSMTTRFALLGTVDATELEQKEMAKKSSHRKLFAR